MDRFSDHSPDLMPISFLRRLFGRLFLFIFFVCIIFPVLPTYAQSSVVIGEVQWAGSEASTADEWIELWNLGNAPFSLNGYRLSGVGSGADLLFGNHDEIPAQSMFLIANYPGNDPKSTLAIQANIVTTTLSITNEKTSIRLLDQTSTVIDEVSWDKTAPAGNSGSPFRSMIRSLTLPVLSWKTATSTQNLRANTTQQGSPGICDECGIDISQTNPLPIMTTSTIPLIPITPPSEETPPPVSSTTEEPPSPETDASPTPLSDENTEAEPILLEPEDEPETESEDPPLLGSEIDREHTTSSEILPLEETKEDETSLLDSATSTLTTVSTSTTATEDPSSPSDEVTVSVPVSRTDLITSPTSTPEIPSLSENTSSTAPITEPINSVQVTSSNSVVEAPILNPPPESVIPSPIVLSPPKIRFHEIYPAPLKGSEWIELETNSEFTLNQLTGWSIRDTKKTIVTFRSNSLVSWNTSEHLLLVSFASGKLPNAGSHLFLVDPQGTVQQELTTPNITKQNSWAQSEDSTQTWRQTQTVTPGKRNLFSATTKKEPVKTALATIKPPTKTGTVKKITPTNPIKAPIKKKSLQQASITKEVATLVAKETSTKTAAKASAKKTSASKTETSTKKKAVPKAKTVTPKKKTSASTTKKKTDVIHPVNLKDIGPMHASTRVRVAGTVATLPRLLGNNAFIIQTDDGRGLYVSGNTKQTSPPFRAHIELTGTMSLNDDGLILHMYASDRWRLMELERAVQARVADLDQPSLEDAWSYTQLRGIVTSVSATRIIMLHGQQEVAISVRPMVRYRTERLKKGDEIEVSGILDTRKDALVLIPRLPEEIRLVQSAPEKVSATSNTAQAPNPPWMPVGVAGASIAVTQGIRRYWKHRLEQKIRFSQPS